MSNERSGSSDLAHLFRPHAIALVGASPDRAKLPGRPLAYLERYAYAGEIYPVNPKHASIGGRRCYASVADLPDDVDLALILLPAASVGEALESCGQRGISFAISIASGFAEAGQHELQRRLGEICRRYRIRLIGPNCVGMVNPRHGVTATFSSELKSKMPRPGSIVLLTQSGALGNSLLQSFNSLDIGLATWVSTGNEADLGVLELLEYFIGADEAGLIVLFVEGLKNGDRLLPLARRAHAAGKRVVVLRAGRSALGRAASLSHTGKLAGAWKVWQGVAAQAGLIEAQSLDEVVDLALLFDVAGYPDTEAAHGLGVLTISGGLGVLISDRAAEADLPMPPFALATQQALRGILPPQMSVTNPVDTALFADESGVKRCAAAVLADPGIGTLLLILTRLAYKYEALVPWLADLGQKARAAGKLLTITYLSSSDRLPRDASRMLLRSGVFILPTAERIVAALGRRRHRAGHRGPVPAAAVSIAGTEAKACIADAPRTSAGFAARAGIPLVQERICRTLPEALNVARETGYPLVLKVVSPDLPHKTEVGGVALNICNETSLQDAWTTMEATVHSRAPNAVITGYSVQPQLADGVELIVGCSIDAELGRVAMVGAGGIWAELIDDVRFIGLPATPEEILAALNSLKLAPLFGGARGKAVLDVEAAIAVIERLAQAFVRETWVAEVDINPLLLLPRGAVALDLLVVSDDSSGREAPGPR